MKKRVYGPVTDACQLDYSAYLPAPRCLTHYAYVRRCAGCGVQFHSSRPHANTCSPRCRQRVSRAERAE